MPTDFEIQQHKLIFGDGSHHSPEILKRLSEWFTQAGMFSLRATIETEWSCFHLLPRYYRRREYKP